MLCKIILLDFLACLRSLCTLSYSRAILDTIIIITGFSLARASIFNQKQQPKVSYAPVGHYSSSS